MVSPASSPDPKPASPPDPTDVQTRRRVHRRIWRRAFVASGVVHLLIFLLWSSERVPQSPFTAAGPRSGDTRAAPGGMTALRLQTTPPLPPEPVVPVPVPDDGDPEPEPEPDPEPTPPTEPLPEPAEEVGETEGMVELDGDDAVGSGEGVAGEEAGADGDGAGAGGVDAEGAAGIIPPTLRGMVMPPTNRNLRGQTIEVWVFVDGTGRVVPDSTLLRPPTRDRNYNRRLLQEATQWVFEPARRGGEAIGAWFPYIIQL